MEFWYFAQIASVNCWLSTSLNCFQIWCLYILYFCFNYCNIYSSEDIMKQMPVEGRKFNKVPLLLIFTFIQTLYMTQCGSNRSEVNIDGQSYIICIMPWFALAPNINTISKNKLRLYTFGIFRRKYVMLIRAPMIGALLLATVKVSTVKMLICLFVWGFGLRYKSTWINRVSQKDAYLYK